MWLSRSGVRVPSLTRTSVQATGFEGRPDRIDGAATNRSGDPLGRAGRRPERPKGAQAPNPVAHPISYPADYPAQPEQHAVPKWHGVFVLCDVSPRRCPPKMLEAASGKCPHTILCGSEQAAKATRGSPWGGVSSDFAAAQM